MQPDPILTALRPRSVREALRVRLVGGWSPVQVCERIDPEEVRRWKADQPGEDIVIERRLVDAVRTALLSLCATGQVRRTTSRYGVELRSKGARAVVVDVFRLA